MKKYFALLCIFTVSSYTQQLSHALRFGEQSNYAAANNDTLNILAVMVQFQEDNTELTSGTGKFDLTSPAEPIIDAPPHDSTYFADHFIFTKNYFQKASNGKQYISATVLGKIITLPKQMRSYAPLNGNDSLIQMIQETWKRADTLNPAFPFQNYNVFVIFHAGVGKDVDLRGTLGYDPTPYDIPSLYFNLSGFQKVLGNSYTGIPIQNSTFFIQNTIVLPSTEVRKIPGVGGDFTLKLGINGLIVASIASYIGLPDLFDTKTGRTAIGRFGLMDGQSLFSFSGICPPEPSAWEKSFLGWTTPIEVYGNKTLSAPAVGLYQSGNDTVYRIPISAKEYFLVENRHRDTKVDGQTIRMKWKGSTIEKTFYRDEEFFSNSNIDSVYGVVLDVDELDWSLPGLVNDNNDYKGGILIWHIDETIIEKNLAANTINVDPLHRGVDVEEADGSQDIGEIYDIVSPGSGSEDGWALDYWFKGNIFPKYKNEFSETSHPNSLSNSFAKSHITLDTFSVSSPRMMFKANVGSSNIQLVKVIKRNNLKLDNNDAPIAADLNGDGKEELIYTSGDSIYVVRDDLTPFLSDSTGLFSWFGGTYQPTVLQYVNNPNVESNIVGIKDNELIIFRNVDLDNNQLADSLYWLKTSFEISTPAMTYVRNIGSAVAQSHIVVGDRSGRRINPYRLSNELWLVDSTQELYQQINGVSNVTSHFVYSTDSVSMIAQKIGFGSRNIKALTVENSLRIFALFDDNTLAVFPIDNPGTISYFKINGSITPSFAVADLNSDNKADIIVGADNKLYALNDNGVILENFPIKVADNGRVVGSPIIVKLAGSNETAILFGSTNGQLYAYTSKGKLINGFPLQTGGIVSSPVLWGDKLVVASTDTSIYVWKTGDLFDTSRVLWGNFLGDMYHSNFIEEPGIAISKSSEILPKKFAYNWPNPTYSSSTNIRYFLGKTATVKIKIVNLAGELVDELNGTNYVGMDNEIVWNVSKIQSGIYFAQITASGSGGEQSQIIKIAVVK